jgi:hypothetical protein
LASSGAERPARVPLTGADCFLRAFDAEISRTNGASHLSQLILRLGPGFDIARLRALVGAAAEAQPILRAPVHREFGLGAAHRERRNRFLRCSRSGSTSAARCGAGSCSVSMPFATAEARRRTWR